MQVLDPTGRIAGGEIKNEDTERSGNNLRPLAGKIRLPFNRPKEPDRFRNRKDNRVDSE